jgi:hypothetical protein
MLGAGHKRRTDDSATLRVRSNLNHLIAPGCFGASHRLEYVAATHRGHKPYSAACRFAQHLDQFGGHGVPRSAGNRQAGKQGRFWFELTGESGKGIAN